MDDDAKIGYKVTAIGFIKEKTNIPVPSIIAWGVGHENPLGLGAFIIMEFIEGEPLDMILRQGTGREESHSLRPDISDREWEAIYRQIANILLELSAHDFSRIGSLSGHTDFNGGIKSRPLTLKMNEIQSHGGVCVGGHVSKTFLSASGYFQDVAEQDMQHLLGQPNSVDDKEDAHRKYVHNKILAAIIPRFVDSKYDNGPFKLICDDFRFGNILVNNAQDLRIVSVLDWEWTYAAPFQMLYSPPRWLLLKKPCDWDAEDVTQYDSLFKMFVNVLEEEQQKRVECRLMPSMATLMQESMENGRFWFHELLYASFESPDSRAWVAIRQLLPSIHQLATVPDSEVESSVNRKMEEQKQYNVEWAALEEKIKKKEADFQALKQRVEEDGSDLELPDHLQ